MIVFQDIYDSFLIFNENNVYFEVPVTAVLDSGHTYRQTWGFTSKHPCSNAFL